MAGEGWGCGTVVDLGPAAVRAARGAGDGGGFNGSIRLGKLDVIKRNLDINRLY